MLKVYKDYHDKCLEVLSISLDQNSEVVERFLEKRELLFQSDKVVILMANKKGKTVTVFPFSL